MVQFNYETDFTLNNEVQLKSWISSCIAHYNFTEGELNYIFCDDSYLHNLNVAFLAHDTLTDIISFDYTLGKLISGDIFISVERVQENAQDFSQTPENELHRVIIHGVLHYMGFKDKTKTEKQSMRAEEEKCLALLHNT